MLIALQIMQTPVDHNIPKKLKISNKATSHHLSPFPFSKRAFKKKFDLYSPRLFYWKYNLYPHCSLIGAYHE